MPQNINFTMDDGLQQDQWKRQQAMADMLRQQSMEPLETNQMAGGYVIPTPKLAGVNKIAQALLAGYKDKKISDERTAYAADQNSKLISGMENYQKALQGTPAAPYQADNPFGEDLGALTNEAVPGSKQSAMATLLNSGNTQLQQTGMQASLAQMLKEPTSEKWGNEPRYDQSGRAFLTSDQGNLRYLDGVNARDKLVSEDTGGQKVFRTEYSPDAVGMLAKTATPDASMTDSRARSEGAANRGITMRGQDMTAGSSAAGRAVTMRGQNLTESRARGTDSKAPSGYRYTASGNLEMIPGGPADFKLQGALNSDAQALSGSTSGMDRLGVAANEVLNHPGLGGIYGMRGVLPNIPGGQAADAQALLNTLKSQVGFSVLQDMRNNSKTGGALGQVSDKENAMLQTNLAALEKAQSVEQARASLKKIVDYSEAAKGRLRNAYNMKHDGRTGGGVAPPASMATSQDATALEWARQNPNDPRSAQIKQKLGVK